MIEALGKHRVGIKWLNYVVDALISTTIHVAVNNEGISESDKIKFHTNIQCNWCKEKMTYVKK